jgi:hypothetical protein
MANEMPNAEGYEGLPRKVLQYSENFLRIINRIKKPDFRETDWAALEEPVDEQSGARKPSLVTSPLARRVREDRLQSHRHYLSSLAISCKVNGPPAFYHQYALS